MGEGRGLRPADHCSQSSCCWYLPERKKSGTKKSEQTRSPWHEAGTHPESPTAHGPFTPTS